MPETKKKVAFYTLGCRVNQYETRAAEEAFVSAGFEIGSFDEKCDVYVINTCTVTAESDRKSRHIIRRAKKAGGEAAIVLAMGCMVQVSPEQTEKISGLDYAAGTRNKMTLVKIALELLEKRDGSAEVSVTDFTVTDSMEKMTVNGADTTRAFLKISDGCNNNCSYCIIPKARGPVCSKPVEDVCQEVLSLCKNGYKEVVLTGIETVSYGKDTKDTDLSELVCKVNGLDCGLERIRLGSIEPTFIKDATASRLASSSKMMPHYHLSLQSGCDSVLAAMRRKYNTRQFLRVLEILREKIPDVTFTTDIIVGFPGETEEMFLETCEFVRKCGFLYVHIFPYSDRAGTDASKMKNKLPDAEKKRRAAVLKDVMLETRKKVLDSYMGSIRSVLVETVKDGIASGHTDNFIEVKFDTGIQKDGSCTGIQKNSLVSVRITGVSDDFEYAKGELVSTEYQRMNNIK